jgi:hypothetical protein
MRNYLDIITSLAKTSPSFANFPECSASAKALCRKARWNAVFPVIPADAQNRKKPGKPGFDVVHSRIAHQ